MWRFRAPIAAALGGGLFVSTLFAALAAASAPPGEHVDIAGFVRAEMPIPITDPDGGALVTLAGMVTRPDRPGRFPLILLNHGRDPKTMAGESPWIYDGIAVDFARRGYAVVTVVRRGYGTSGGTDHENTGPCARRRFLEAGTAAGDDVTLALERLRREPWVDPGRVVLIGQSAGGFAVTAAAARNPPGVVAVISFAGGNGSDGKGHVCGSEGLVAAEGRFGATARVPSLWIYTENDHYFDPTLARAMANAFAAGGAPVEFHLEPAFESEGHWFFARGAKSWRPLVEAFLRARGLPTEVAIALPVIPPPASLGASGREGFAAYLANPDFEKAFAASPAGAWGWDAREKTIADAEKGALESCAKHGNGCRVFAVGNERAP